MAAMLMRLALLEARGKRRVLFACHRPVRDYARLCLSQKGGKALPSSNLLLWDARRASPVEFIREVRRQEKAGLKLLVVDSLRDLGYEWKLKDQAKRLSKMAEECQILVVAGLELPPPFESRPWGAVRPRLSDLSPDVLHHADGIVSLHPKTHTRAAQMCQTMVLESLQDPTGCQPRMEMKYDRASGGMALCPG